MDNLPYEILDKIINYVGNEGETFLNLMKTSKYFFIYFKTFHRMTIINDILWKKYINILIDEIKEPLINFCKEKEIVFIKEDEQYSVDIEAKNFFNENFINYLKSDIFNNLHSYFLNKELIKNIITYKHVKYDYNLTSIIKEMDEMKEYEDSGMLINIKQPYIKLYKNMLEYLYNDISIDYVIFIIEKIYQCFNNYLLTNEISTNITYDMLNQSNMGGYRYHLLATANEILNNFNNYDPIIGYMINQLDKYRFLDRIKCSNCNYNICHIILIIHYINKGIISIFQRQYHKLFNIIINDYHNDIFY